MAKKKRKPPDVQADEFDMTPMIDVTFQLIIFFLLANDLSRKDVVDLTLPQALFGKEDKDSQKDPRIVINIRKPADPQNPGKVPDITVKGVQYDLKSLEKQLQVLSNMKREGDGKPGNPSAVYVLIRADREVPWSHVQYVMQVCADQKIQIYKMQFATTRRDDGKATGVAELVKK